MTEENRRDNIAEEIERAEAARRAAELLSQSGLFSDAVSRLYYFLFHWVRALLLTEGLEPRTHEGMLRMLAQRFVKKGAVAKEVAHTVSRLMKYREEADYNPSYVFAEDDYWRLREETVTAVSAIKQYVEKKGYGKK